MKQYQKYLHKIESWMDIAIKYMQNVVRLKKNAEKLWSLINCEHIDDNSLLGTNLGTSLNLVCTGCGTTGERWWTWSHYIGFINEYVNEE